MIFVIYHKVEQAHIWRGARGPGVFLGTATLKKNNRHTAMEASIFWRASENGANLSSRKVVPLLQAAVAAAPERRDLKLELVKVLFEADRMAEAAECAAPLATDRDAEPKLLYYYGCAALAIGDLDRSLEALQSAAERGFIPAYRQLGKALLKAGRLDDAIEAGVNGLKHPTRNFSCLGSLARALLRSGQAERLWQLCVDLRRHDAWGGYFPAIMASAAEATGHSDEAASLLDPDRWYAASELALPNDFNALLAEELMSHSALGATHSSNATHGTGVWIPQLERHGGPLAQRLLVMIRNAIECYIDERLKFSHQPFMAHRPQCAALASWSMEVRDDGFQSPHIHPSGWLSGVYYVTVPDVETANDPYAGAIEFGLLPLCQTSAGAVARWREVPRPGQLLLFPSYYAHWTRPTGSKAPRICVAFDVIAAPTAVQ